jgi:hypothetical protein
MANLWEQAPIVSEPASASWEDAPVVEEPAAPAWQSAPVVEPAPAPPPVNTPPPPSAGVPLMAPGRTPPPQVPVTPEELANKSLAAIANSQRDMGRPLSFEEKANVTQLVREQHGLNTPGPIQPTDASVGQQMAQNSGAWENFAVTAQTALSRPVHGAVRWVDPQNQAVQGTEEALQGRGGVSGFAGAVAGNLVSMAPAFALPGYLPVTMALGAGNARADAAKARDAGQPVSGVDEAANVAIDFAANYLISKLQMGQASRAPLLTYLGQAMQQGGAKGLAQAAKVVAAEQGKAALAEGFEEAVQGVITQKSRNTFLGENKSEFAQAPQDFALGAAASVPLSLAGDVVQPHRPESPLVPFATGKTEGPPPALPMPPPPAPVQARRLPKPGSDPSAWMATLPPQEEAPRPIYEKNQLAMAMQELERRKQTPPPSVPTLPPMRQPPAQQDISVLAQAMRDVERRQPPPALPPQQAIRPQYDPAALGEAMRGVERRKQPTEPTPAGEAVAPTPAPSVAPVAETKASGEEAKGNRERDQLTARRRDLSEKLAGAKSAAIGKAIQRDIDAIDGQLTAMDAPKPTGSAKVDAALAAKERYDAAQRAYAKLPPSASVDAFAKADKELADAAAALEAATKLPVSPRISGEPKDAAAERAAVSKAQQPPVKAKKPTKKEAAYADLAAKDDAALQQLQTQRLSNQEMIDRALEERQALLDEAADMNDDGTSRNALHDYRQKVQQIDASLRGLGYDLKANPLLGVDEHITNREMRSDLRTAAEGKLQTRQVEADIDPTESPEPAKPAEPSESPFTRTTPKGGSDEEAALLQEGRALEDQREKAYAKWQKVLGTVDSDRIGEKTRETRRRAANSLEKAYRELDDKYTAIERQLHRIALEDVAEGSDPTMRALARARINKDFSNSYLRDYQPVTEQGKALDAKLRQQVSEQLKKYGTPADGELQKAMDVVLSNDPVKGTRDAERLTDWAAQVATWDRRRREMLDRFEGFDLPKEVKDNARRDIDRKYKYASDAKDMEAFVGELEGKQDHYRREELAKKGNEEKKLQAVRDITRKTILKTLEEHPAGISAQRMTDAVEFALLNEGGVSRHDDASRKVMMGVANEMAKAKEVVVSKRGDKQYVKLAPKAKTAPVAPKPASEMSMGEALAAASRGERLPDAIAAKYRISQDSLVNQPKADASPAIGEAVTATDINGNEVEGKLKAMGQESAYLTVEGVTRRVQANTVRRMGSRSRGAVALPDIDLPNPFRRPDPTVGATMELSNESTWDAIRRKVQDEFLPIARLQQDVARQGGNLSESSDVYLKQELFKGKAADAMRMVQEDYAQPIARQMADAGLELADVDEYLYALHAPERNRQIAKVNPSFAGLYADGSGMTDAQAAAVVAKVKASGQRAAYESIAAKVHDLNNTTLDRMVDAGLLSGEAADAMRSTYEYYVPLRTDMEADGANVRTGQGFNIKGKDSVRAAGRGSRADSPLTFSLMQANEKIVRAEKNRVGQALLKLVQDNPDPGLWEINKTPTTTVIDPATGMARQQVDHRFQLAENVLAVKVKGETQLIEFKGEAGEKIGRAMKKLGYQDGGRVLRWLGKGMRVYRSLQTNLNPEFLVPNLIRDVQTAGINLTSEKSAAFTKGFLKGIPKAWKAVWDVGGNHAAKKGSEFHDYMREYLAHGGKIDTYAMGDFQTTQQTLTTLLKDAKPTTARRVLLATRKAGKTVDRLNGATENASRLSAYIQARKSGMSAERSASLAKNLTVNFERKGETGAFINTLYMFANASIQGNARMAKALFTTRRGGKIAAGIVAAGFGQAMLRGLFEDDEEGRNVYDTIPDGIKASNLIIPTGGKKYVKLPLPYGFNVLFSAGRLAGDVLNGSQAPGEASANLLTSVAGAFNPLGNESTLLQTLSPTIIDPIAQYAENKDWTGRAIVPTQNPYAPEKPNSELSRRDTSAYAKDVAQWLNRVSGGDEVTAGKVDIAPDLIDHFLGWATGGTGRFVMRTAKLPGEIAQGDVAPGAVPIARRFVGEESRGLDFKDLYETADAGKKALADLKHYQENDQADKAEGLRTRQAEPLAFARWARDVVEQVSAHRKAEAVAMQQGNSAKAKAERQQAERLAGEFVKAYRTKQLPARWKYENELADLNAKKRKMQDAAKEASKLMRAGKRQQALELLNQSRMSRPDRIRFARLNGVNRYIRRIEKMQEMDRLAASEAERRINQLIQRVA